MTPAEQKVRSKAMAEYINREDLKFLEIPIAPVLQGEQVHYEQGILKEWLEGVHTADVIERSEYEFLKKENKELAIKYDNAMNMVINGNEQLEKLRSKIDKAIDEIDFLRQHRAKYITEDNKICIDSGEVLKILKNIGE